MRLSAGVNDKGPVEFDGVILIHTRCYGPLILVYENESLL